MIFSLLIIHNHDRMSSITRVLHTTTWNFFTSRLPHRFCCSPKEVMEAIMADINDLVQEFWGTSGDGTVGASLIPMHLLFEILRGCFDNFKVCLDVAAVDLADKNLQWLTNPSSPDYSPLLVEIGAKFKILIDEYRKMFDQSISKDLCEILKFLPGVLVQMPMSTQGMADLYRINPDLLVRLTKSPIEPIGLRLSASLKSPYTLDGYLSGFLQDQDRSQLYHCDPMLQHISLCRHFLFLKDGSNASDLQS